MKSKSKYAIPGYDREERHLQSCGSLTMRQEKSSMSRPDVYPCTWNPQGDFETITSARDRDTVTGYHRIIPENVQ